VYRTDALENVLVFFAVKAAQGVPTEHVQPKGFRAQLGRCFWPRRRRAHRRSRVTRWRNIPKAVGISRYRVIVEVALHYRLEPLSGLLRGLVHALSKLMQADFAGGYGHVGRRPDTEHTYSERRALMTSTREARAAGNADAITAAARSRSAEAATGNASGIRKSAKYFAARRASQ